MCRSFSNWSCWVKKRQNIYDEMEQMMATILVADDDKVMLGLLTTLLELEGDQAITISRPEQIKPTAKEIHPSLILLDYYLAGGISTAALRELKSDPELKDIPVLVASGMDRREECFDAGADGFILKPFRPTELLARIHELTTQGES